MDVDWSWLEDDGDSNERASVGGPKPAPIYSALNAVGDGPDRRYGHTLTAVPALGKEGAPNYVGPRLILFGGLSRTSSGLSLATTRLCRTTYVHCYDVLTNTWSRITPIGEPPTPRAAHVAIALGSTKVIIQGGLGSAQLSDENLYILDLAQPPRWHRLVVKGPGPGPRYGHVMAALERRYLILIGGSNGNQPLADVWALDVAAKPFKWQKLEPEGDGPPPCLFAAASARSDGLLLFCGGQDENSVAQACAYGLARHRDGRWEWAIAPGVSPSPRCQHAAVFVNGRFHVCGGVVGNGRMVEASSSIAVFDTAARVWCDTKSVVTSPRTGRYGAGRGVAVELTRRCRHAVAAIDNLIFIYGGLRGGGVLLDDLLVAEDLGGGGMTSTASQAVAAAVAASNAQLGRPPGFC